MKVIAGEVLEKGSISIKSDNNQHDYILRVLDINDLSAVMKLQSRLIDIMEQKELYVPITEEEMVQLFEGAGEALGLYIDNKLYAACSLLSQVPYESNMARELNFSEEELFRVAQLELSLVDPDLRGHKLQYRMAGILANRVRNKAEIRYLFTTVSPHNYPSIETVTSMGLYIAKLSKMYFDWDRYVVYRDFINPVQLDTANTVIVANTSFEEQQELLKNDYRGYSQFKDQDGIKIMYARKL